MPDCWQVVGCFVGLLDVADRSIAALASARLIARKPAPVLALDSGGYIC